MAALGVCALDSVSECGQVCKLLFTTGFSEAGTISFNSTPTVQTITEKNRHQDTAMSLG